MPKPLSDIIMLSVLVECMIEIVERVQAKGPLRNILLYIMKRFLKSWTYVDDVDDDGWTSWKLFSILSAHGLPL